jgi:hypothetical protein
MKVKLKRGQKICKKCNTINACRSRSCKDCANPFISKNIPIKNEITDWRNVELGTYIKVVQGTGPYFVSKKDTEESKIGERVCMGDTGVFRVLGIDKKGLRVHGASGKNSGFSYLYMGTPTVSKTTGINLDPYRIKKIKFKNRKGKK